MPYILSATLRKPEPPTNERAFKRCFGEFTTQFEVVFHKQANPKTLRMYVDVGGVTTS
jgi:hypothetical protein